MSAAGQARAPRTTRQWVVLGVAAVLLATLCLVAGRWQWDRYEDRSAQIDLIEANWSAAAVPVEDVLDGPGAVLPDDAVWQPVTLTGRYESDATVLLRNRPVHSTPGYHVLVPFVAEHPDAPDGIVVVIDRGFVPLGADGSAPASVPEAPAGEVEVTASLRLDEPPSSRGAPEGQVQAISTAQVLAAGPDGAAWADGRTVGAYGALRAEEPRPATAPVALPAPDTDPGSHLSYAFQWGVFSVGAIAGYVLLWRRERGALRGATVSAGDLLLAAPDVDAATGGTTSRARRPARPGARGLLSRPTADSDDEDALIDSQLR
ncbi:SURF1 family protein [Myceligenerans pegani]|uniref:SURF1-like protein n=1 Tax=Myceligenerans pegani TaxID=2776917 RepID=A0ABR9MXU0_9MICO|nr:SURF1 family protein [Myceligenerans sp. TRM 65318]MBE1875739.1 SURF1 family protein [Myceligenerans sp. TRM 65318]MBE3018010.1 SURF1 family protein [Myceligenerans sp. TRM 65318]